MYYFILDGKEVEYNSETSKLFDPSKHVVNYRDEGVSDEVLELDRKLTCQECDFYCGCKVCEKFRPSNNLDEDDDDVWII